MAETLPIQESRRFEVRSMHPQKFALWLFLITVTMIFASLTSAYIVKKGEGNWLIIDFPDLFIITSVIIVVSSLTMHFAYLSAKKDRAFAVRLWLFFSGILSVAFIGGQYMAWGQLINQDIYFVGNPAGSFIYVFTGLHIAHLFGGIIFLTIVLIRAFQNQIHSKNLVSLEMCATYWHFLGGLWLYLYLFLIANN
ncbi:MAG: cytochrome c oxidase subunit 3 [Cyclobacteriaceae bacterium]|nr:cytochrome c oxidase subunit 3 [Cyclobacteriaceae bacterium]